jgi:hypothetical protein
MKEIYHIHHIVPKYMGGTDEPNNLVKLPLWAHAEVHRRLFEVYGNIEDDIASRMLSGKTEGVEELRIELAKRNYKKWLKEKPEEVEKWKEKQRRARRGKPSILPPEHYQKQAEKFRGIPRSQEVKDKISKAKKGKFVPQPNQMKTYEVVKPNGEVFIVKGLNEFCKNEGIDASNMCNVAKGKFKQHKGYKCRFINT